MNCKSARVQHGTGIAFDEEFVQHAEPKRLLAHANSSIIDNDHTNLLCKKCSVGKGVSYCHHATIIVTPSYKAFAALLLNHGYARTVT